MHLINIYSLLLLQIISQTLFLKCYQVIFIPMSTHVYLVITVSLHNQN